ncbi:hypothetical protein JD551_13020 [Aeromonas caviae]|uniref:hypothetical protein n=1 Tax=Aeromonas caviae TaxID=648 RepID=UPI00191D7915|nr:hypothetical protein [Aeromonas caviae]MBL0549954.1 hypothetical protein [Aeromonas caviae]
MIVINSAAYVVPEFRTELGTIPPCLLPLGNQKLVQHQVATLRKFSGSRIVVSLPASYELTLDDRNLLQMLDIEAISVPDGFTLAEALTYILNIASDGEEGVRLLHGDTLILDLPDQLDVVSVGRSRGDYEWEVESPGSEEASDELVWSGYFSFSSQREFLRALALSRGHFVKAVRHYGTVLPLTLVNCQDWFDLGHVNTYFTSRSRITTQRSFNSLRVSEGVLYKTGTPAEKIEAEERWFKSVPLAIKKYTPHLLDAGVLPEGGRFYALEYLPYLPLNELFVHGRNPVSYWMQKFSLLNKFFSDAREVCQLTSTEMSNISQDAYSLYRDKTISRLEQYAKETGFSVSAEITRRDGRPLSVEQIAEDCIKRVLAMPVIPAVMHGDICFSNILFDSRSERLKVVDPRGINVNGDFSIYGDQKYDLAKLTHSVIGLYDFIIAGRYTFDVDADGHEVIHFEIDSRLSMVQEGFMRVPFLDGVTIKDVMPLVVLLFLSMLPLHSDRQDRQKAMLLNAVRLYKTFVH